MPPSTPEDESALLPPDSPPPAAEEDAIQLTQAAGDGEGGIASEQLLPFEQTVLGSPHLALLLYQRLWTAFVHHVNKDNAAKSARGLIAAVQAPSHHISKATMKAVACAAPASTTALAAVEGMGTTRAQRWGQILLDVTADFKANPPTYTAESPAEAAASRFFAPRGTKRSRPDVGSSGIQATSYPKRQAVAPAPHDLSAEFDELFGL